MRTEAAGRVNDINLLLGKAAEDGELPYACDLNRENGYQKIALGRGSPNAHIMVVGEYPGREELRQGLAMVGPTGKYVEEQLRRAGLDPSKDVYITNVMSTRPPYGSTPTPLALKAHKRYLKWLLDAIQPQLVLTLGRLSSNLFRCHLSTRAMCGCVEDRLGPQDRFSQLESMRFLHGCHFTCHRYSKGRSFLVMPLYNPAYMLRDTLGRAEELKDWTQKLHLALCLLKEEPPEPLPRIHRYDFQEALQRTEQAGVSSPGLPLHEAEVAWCDASSRLYTQPSWRIVQPQDPESLWRGQPSLVFQSSNLEYDEPRNVFHAYGPAERSGGMSVHALITGFRFSFQASLPLSLKGCSQFEAELGQLQQLLQEVVNEKQFQALKRCYPATARHCQRPPPLLLRLSLLHGKKSESECYLPDEPPDLHLNFEVQHHQHKQAVAAAYGEATRGRYPPQDYSQRLRFFHLDLSPIQHLTYQGRIWEACWSEADLSRTRFVRPGESDFISNADVQIELPWDALTSHNACFELGLSETEKARWSAHPSKRVHVFDTEFLSEDLKFPRPSGSPLVCISNEVHYHGPQMRVNSKGQTDTCEVHSFVLGFCAPQSAELAAKHLRDYPPGTLLRVHHFRDELHMFNAWMQFMLDLDPEESVGHNSKAFDMRMLVERANHLMSVRRKREPVSPSTWDTYNGFVFNISRRADVRTFIRQRRFASRAFGERVITEVVCPGRSILDTMEIYMRERKESSYGLNALSTKYLGDTKNDVPYVAIPGLYLGGFHSLERLKNYCDQDVALTGRLYHLHKWSTMSLELARATRSVSQSQLYTKGQQIRVVSVMMNYNEDLGRPWLLQTRERKSQKEREALEAIPEPEPEPEDRITENWLLQEEEEEEEEGVSLPLPEEEQEWEGLPSFPVLELSEEQLADRHSFVMPSEPEPEPKPPLRQSLLLNGCKRRRMTIGDEDLLLPRALRTKSASTQRQKRLAAEARKKKQERSRFTGATVVEILKGFHSDLPVLVCDWTSLYPSLQREKNVDGSSLLYESDFLLPRYAGKIDKERDCSSPPTQALNPATRRYERLYYVKPDFQRGDKRMGKGLIPLSVEALISLRADCRRAQRKQPKNSVGWSVLEGGQLGFKIIANSFFGSTGVEEGQVSRPELGSSICAYGRQALQSCLDILERQFEGQKLSLPGDREHVCKNTVTGGDTDSFFIKFSFVRSAEEAAEFGPLSTYVINKQFQPPMKLEYEKALFPLFQIAKKRYSGFCIIDSELESFFAKKRYLEMNYLQVELPSLFQKRLWSVEHIHQADSFEGQRLERTVFQNEAQFQAYVGAEKFEQLMATLGKLSFQGLCELPQSGARVCLSEWYDAGVLFSVEEWREKLEEQQRLSFSHYDQQGFQSWVKAFYGMRRCRIPYLDLKTKGRVFSRGVETVRRDSCPLTRRLMTSFLHKVLIEEDLSNAVLEYVNVSQKLLAGEVPLHELICTKQFSRPLAAYKNQTLPHICIIKRQIAAGQPPPALGSRISYFVVVQPTREVTGGGLPKEETKLANRAYTPDEVINGQLSIDFLYYYQRLLAKPMGRLLELLLPDPSALMDPKILCPKRIQPQVTNSALARMPGVIRSRPCVLCDRVSTRGVICSSCLNGKIKGAGHRERVSLLSSLDNDLEELATQMQSRLQICQNCTSTNNPDPDSIVCTYYTCPNYIPRKKAVAAHREALQTRKDTEYILTETPYRPQPPPLPSSPLPQKERSMKPQQTLLTKFLSPRQDSNLVRCFP